MALKRPTVAPVKGPLPEAVLKHGVLCRIAARDPKLSSAVLDLDSSEGWRAVFAGLWRTSPGGRLFVTAVQVSRPLAGSGRSCINAAVALVARRSASAGLGVAATPSSKPTIRPSQRSPRYCVAISVGSPGPMSPID